ncbi:MAG: hypothetical protein HKN20_05260, partial [Gemmatimonadetes bacterium]|nr:hypothetical protein [Gemmatimonadota bacterium]
MTDRRNPARETTTLEPLVEPAWLERHLGDADLRVVDATVQVKLWPWPRIRSGRRGYERAHVPGAVFANLMEISDPGAPRHT